MLRHLLLLLAAFPAAALHALADAPDLSAEGDPAAGHVTLTWTAGSPRYQLQEAETADFEQPITRYEGAHTSSVRSGLPNGISFFRVRQQVGEDSGTPRWGPWSEPVRFEVEHHSRTLAFSLCALGALVFLTTGGFLLRASRQSHD